ncbi:MAG TPA: PBP1A family penicillin-binding protein [Candidatus Gastranaerophilales bacterium]|nr:PBP1A family penicillin-binding protein [Candidatus Gastranaerophilales bacterium]
MNFYKKRKGGLLYIAALMLAFGLAGITAVFMHLNTLPSIEQLDQYEPTLTSQIVSADDYVIKTFGAYKYTKVSIEQIPEDLKNAIIAIEDKNFYSHHGFDVVALIRSTIKNIMARKVVQGASTITQQLARVLFLSQEKTFSRKFKELIIAYRLEKTISKDKILEMYLNNVYLGEGAYGVAAAADIYFNKSVESLNLQECAVLAGLPQAPSVYSPYRNMDLTLKRRAMVLKRMYDDGHISKEMHEKASNSKIRLSTVLKQNAFKKAPYFIDFVMRELQEKVGFTEEEIVQGGYKIYTTLNYECQKAAEISVENNLKSWNLSKPYEQAALISYDVVSGQVLAYIGGKSYTESQFDRVSQAIRQPGSSFKIFIYTNAMENGLTPLTVYPDAPISIGDWHPQNYGRKYRGPLPLYKALAFSSNTIAAKLIMDMGVEEVIQTARKMGINTPIVNDPTIALGSSAVKPIELATAYGVLANGGVKVQPYGIERIESSNGKVIYQASNSYERVLDIKTVAYMVEMMKQVVNIGTGRGSKIDRPSAGKTGTTDSYRDAWFVGFTPDIVTAVWVGNDNNTSMKNLTGGTLPATIWRDYMKVITEGKPVMDFMYPEIVVDKTKDKEISQEELEKMLKEGQLEIEEIEKIEKSEVINTELKTEKKDPQENTAETAVGTPDENTTDEQTENTEENANGTKETLGETELNDKFTPPPVPVNRIQVKNYDETSTVQRKSPIETSGF